MRRSAGSFADDAAAQAAFLPAAELDRLRREITARQQRLAQAEGAAAELTRATEVVADQGGPAAGAGGRPDPAGPSLQAQLRQADAALQRNEAAAQQIAGNAAAYDAAMERCAVAEDVYRTVSGQQSQRASQPGTHIQHDLQEVVAAANLRLTALSGGVYRLRCKPAVRDLRAQSGLDLDVLDANTGLWRDVVLSGGESSASLALASGAVGYRPGHERRRAGWTRCSSTRASARWTKQRWTRRCSCWTSSQAANASSASSPTSAR